jgi:hypothetical protein
MTLKVAIRLTSRDVSGHVNKGVSVGMSLRILICGLYFSETLRWVQYVYKYCCGLHI